MQNNHDLESAAEEHLVWLSQRGRRDAFGELIRRNYNVSLKLAVSILRQREEAEDEVQNAWSKAFQHIGQFHSEARFSTWMTRIVVNQCLMRLRQTRRAKLVFIDDIQPRDENATVELRDTGRSPEGLARGGELTAALYREIRHIPPLLRNVFMLREVEELSMQDVARRLGISVAAAKSRLLRARVELRGRLQKHGGESAARSARVRAAELW